MMLHQIKAIEVAKEFGVKNFIIHPYNKGFRKAFFFWDFEIFRVRCVYSYKHRR